MMILQETYTLSNGIEIPKLGLGTWFISDENAGQAMKDAVNIGYRHIDTAQAYGNEKGEPGERLKKPIKRENFALSVFPTLSSQTSRTSLSPARLRRW